MTTYTTLFRTKKIPRHIKDGPQKAQTQNKKAAQRFHALFPLGKLFLCVCAFLWLLQHQLNLLMKIVARRLSLDLNAAHVRSDVQQAADVAGEEFL